MKKYILLALLPLLFVSCAEQITRGQQYPKMYEEKPIAIVIMPPINQTKHVEAKDYFYTTMYRPLCDKGYYVFSPSLTMELFQTESAYDAEMFIENDLSQFRNVLGADAAMFTTIKSWKKNNLFGTISVKIEYLLRSTKTGDTLYKREGSITIDTSVDLDEKKTDKSFFESLLNVAATAVNTATTDKIIAGRRCTAFVLSDMPVGKYDSRYGQDQDFKAGKPYV